MKYHLANGLSRAIAGLEGKVSRLRHAALPENLRPDKMTPVFDKGFNDRIAYTEAQWERQRIYTRENPRRYLLKRMFTDFMLRRWHLKIGEIEYEAKGNIMLLKEPELLFVKHHRAWSAQESDDYQKACRRKIDNGSVAVSPFIHAKEKELRDYAINEGGCYIRICDNGFAERQSASGFEFDLMAAGRLLLIAPLEHDSRRRDMKYSRAQELNQIAFKLVETHEAGGSCIIKR